MKRQLALLDYALGSLRRRRGKHVTLALGLVFASGLYAAVIFLAGSLDAEWRGTLASTPPLLVQRLEGGRPALIDAHALDGFADAPGVASVEPRVWGYLFVEALESNLTIVATRHDSDLAAALESGSPPVADDEAVVGSGLVDLVGLVVGDRLAVPGADGEPRLLRVTGVLAPETSAHTADALVVSDATARALLGVPAGRATDLAFALHNDDEAVALGNRILAEHPSFRVIARSQLVRTYALTFDGRAGIVAGALLPVLAALLLIAWDRLTGLSGDERREIGVLKAIGWHTADILAAKLWESGVVATFGASLGLLAAYAYVYLLGAPGMLGTLLGWSNLVPHLELAPAMSISDVLALFGLIVGPYMAASVVPAWRAAVADPDRSMRLG